MDTRNTEAEELMKKIEKEEEAISFKEPDKKLFHLCIVNLVIGTLYCSKGHYEFGISRVMKSLEPYNKKLGTDTWFYAKRCFLSLLEQLSKQLVVLKDSTLQDCIQFFDHCEGACVSITFILFSFHPRKLTGPFWPQQFSPAPIVFGTYSMATDFLTFNCRFRQKINLAP